MALPGPRNRDLAILIVLLVVGEDHQLGDVEEGTEGFIPHPGVDAATFSKYSLVVEGLFDLYEGKQAGVR